MDEFSLKGALEAMLFASGDPLPVSRLAEVLETDENSVFKAAQSLSTDYENPDRGIRLVLLNGSLQLHSAPQYASLITKVLEQRKPPRLSQTSLEVLAIVAYYQPVTRAYVEQMRGIDSSYTLGVLLERGMIEAQGHLEAVGRPTLYGTTDLFLRTMGISSLEQLPPLPDLAQSDAVRELQERVEQLRATEEKKDEASASEEKQDGSPKGPKEENEAKAGNAGDAPAGQKAAEEPDPAPADA